MTVDVQQVQQCLLQVLPVPEQGIIIGCETGILQGENTGIAVDIGIFLHPHIADGAGVTGHSQRRMDIQLAFADLSIVFRQNGNLFVILWAIVGDKHHGLSAGDGFHGGIQAGAVSADCCYLLALFQFIRLNLGSHVAVQRNVGQRTVLGHAGRHIGALFRQNALDTAGNTGSDLGIGGIALGIGNLIIQVIQLVLHTGQGGHDGGHVHGGQNVAFFHLVLVFHQHLNDLHAHRHGDIFQVHLGQGAAAGDHGVDGSGHHHMGLHIRSRGSEAVLHLAAQMQHHRHQDQGDHGNGDKYITDQSVSAFLLVLAQGLK